MKANDVKKDPERGQYKAIVCLRITEDIKEWLHKNKYSPTKIFRTAIKELGYKPK